MATTKDGCLFSAYETIKNYRVPCVLQSEYVKARLNEWIIAHGGTTNVFQTAYVKHKSRQKMNSKFGVDYSLQSPEIKSKYDFKSINAKGNETKKINGTFNTSKIEEQAYMLLCEKFSQDDVIRQYKSEQYPFNCDFYIKSKDLYIECNFSWTHGGHWFDPTNKDDIKRLELMKSKHSKYYDNAIETWTVRDTKKRETALKNQLNYVVFWRLCELQDWLKFSSKSK